MDIFQIYELEDRNLTLQEQVNHLLYKVNDLHQGLRDLIEDVNIFLLFYIMFF